MLDRKGKDDMQIGTFDGYTVMYTEDYSTICGKCCIANACTQEGFCKCDEFRRNENISLEGDVYFVNDESKHI